MVLWSYPPCRAGHCYCHLSTLPSSCGYTMHTHTHTHTHKFSFFLFFHFPFIQLLASIKKVVWWPPQTLHRPVPQQRAHSAGRAGRLHHRGLRGDAEGGTQQQGHDLHQSQDATGHPAPRHCPGQSSREILMC